MKSEKRDYTSGHCEIGRHGSCRGVYAGTACACSCGHGAPVQAQLVFVPEVMPSRARVFDPAPLLAPLWLGTDCLAVTA